MTEFTDFGRFNAVWEEGDPVLYFKNEDGLDWYEMQWALATWNRKDGEFINSVYGAWVMVDDEGTVTYVDKDPTKVAPHFHRVLGVNANPKDIRLHMHWDGKEFK
jgi:hypothetical protein